jgi:hypothetical protein
MSIYVPNHNSLRGSAREDEEGSLLYDEQSVQEAFARHYNPSSLQRRSSPSASGGKRKSRRPFPQHYNARSKADVVQGSMYSSLDGLDSSKGPAAGEETSPRLFWQSQQQFGQTKHVNKGEVPKLRGESKRLGRSRKNMIPMQHKNASEDCYVGFLSTDRVERADGSLGFRVGEGKQFRREEDSFYGKDKGTFEDFGLGHKKAYYPGQRGEIRAPTSLGRKNCTALAKESHMEDFASKLETSVQFQHETMASLEDEMNATRHAVSRAYMSLLLRKPKG